MMTDDEYEHLSYGPPKFIFYLGIGTLGLISLYSFYAAVIKLMNGKDAASYYIISGIVLLLLVFRLIQAFKKSRKNSLFFSQDELVIPSVWSTQNQTIQQSDISERKMVMYENQLVLKIKHGSGSYKFSETWFQSKDDFVKFLDYMEIELDGLPKTLAEEYFYQLEQEDQIVTDAIQEFARRRLQVSIVIDNARIFLNQTFFTKEFDPEMNDYEYINFEGSKLEESRISQLFMYAGVQKLKLEEDLFLDYSYFVIVPSESWAEELNAHFDHDQDKKQMFNKIDADEENSPFYPMIGSTSKLIRFCSKILTNSWVNQSLDFEFLSPMISSSNHIILPFLELNQMNNQPE